MSSSVALPAQPLDIQAVLSSVPEVVVRLWLRRSASFAACQTRQTPRLDCVRHGGTSLDLLPAPSSPDPLGTSKTVSLTMPRPGLLPAFRVAMSRLFGPTSFRSLPFAGGCLSQIGMAVTQASGDPLRGLLIGRGLCSLRGVPLFVRSVLAGRRHPVIIVSRPAFLGAP
mgnify:CR=1 FL=1